MLRVECKVAIGFLQTQICEKIASWVHRDFCNLRGMGYCTKLINLMQPAFCVTDSLNKCLTSLERVTDRVCHGKFESF